MNCPKCENEYDEQTTVCPDCGEKLISASSDTDRIVYEAMKPVKLVNVTNSIEAGIIMNMLLNNDIPCFKKDKFLGSYMNLYMGYSVFGEDIYVDERDYEKALDIISVMTPVEGEEDPDMEDDALYEASDASDTGYEALAEADEKDNTPEKYPVFYKNPAVVARIILGFILAGVLFAAIINYIY